MPPAGGQLPEQVIIMGAGPAGLAAAHVLTSHGVAPLVFERSPWVGGLARTVERNGFRFDIGGHRWFTKKDEVHQFFVDVVGDELIDVDRVSRIYFEGKYFYYPLKIGNALSGMGLRRSLRALADAVAIKVRPLAIAGEPTMEQAYVNQFGRTLYEQFFKTYSEKVWGMPCDLISGDWVAQRSKGLSLTTAIKDAFSRSRGEVESLVDRFSYPRLGIGRFSERMADDIRAGGGRIELESRVVRIHHDGPRVTGVTVRRAAGDALVEGDAFISSIPITQLVKAFRPAAPAEVVAAAEALQFRELVTVNLMLKREQVTPDTWLYIHDPDITFARIHEPKNWSAAMAPDGTTSLVCELFCNRGDAYWTAPDDALVELAVKDFEGLGFFQRREVIDGFVIRAVRAYPTYTLGYQRHLDIIKGYLRQFDNLQIVGRYGTFRYNNSDHSVETGILAARNLLGECHAIDLVNSEPEYLEERRRVAVV
jgi:protoporphyrinogen oxidase